MINVCDYENPWTLMERPFTSDDVHDFFEALCISLPISQTNDNTLGESIFGLLENQKERREKSNKRVIGSGIMGHVQN